MTQKNIIVFKFVEFVPPILEDMTIYISIPYATAVHKCCCGCGNLVVTPLDPTDWTLIFDGKTISLDPSIGNWSFKCQSHYWIRNNNVLWVPQLSSKTIKSQDNQQLKNGNCLDDFSHQKAKKSVWQKIFKWFKP